MLHLQQHSSTGQAGSTASLACEQAQIRPRPRTQAKATPCPELSHQVCLQQRQCLPQHHWSPTVRIKLAGLRV